MKMLLHLQRQKCKFHARCLMFVPEGSSWATPAGCWLPATSLPVMVAEGTPTANAFCWLFKRKRKVLIELNPW